MINTKPIKQVKIIQKNIEEVLNKSKDFSELHLKFKEEIKDINDNLNSLKDKSRKLLNILLKYPKKLILFKFENEQDKLTYFFIKKYEIGINNTGLGITTNRENNLRNINDYYAKNMFMDLLKNPKFYEEFLSCLKKRFKKDKKDIKIIIKIIQGLNDNIKIKKEIEVEEIIIEIDNNVSYYKKSYERYDKYIEILRNNEDVYDTDNEYLKEAFDKSYNFDFKDLAKYCYLLKYKQGIIKVLKKELKNYQKINKKIKNKLNEIEKELIPYEALEKI